MAKITLKADSLVRAPSIDTDCMDVLIEDAFLGVEFKSPDGESLIVSMRDGGFEVCYDDIWYEFKGGSFTSYGEKLVKQEVDLNEIALPTDFENAARDRARELLNYDMNLKIIKDKE